LNQDELHKKKKEITVTQMIVTFLQYLLKGLLSHRNMKEIKIGITHSA